MATRSLLSSSRASVLATELPPLYLAPSLLSHAHAFPQTQSSNFSTTTSLAKRETRDRNPNRGVSTIRRTGPKQKLSMQDFPLPRPVLAPTNVLEIKTNPNHGLWGFFPESREAVSTPEEDRAHGRAWTVPELRQKSWSDLHSLWWMCLRELNRLGTSNAERSRLQLGFGGHEASLRKKEILKTQACIKATLLERWYLWEDARKLFEEQETSEEQAKVEGH